MQKGNQDFCEAFGLHLTADAYGANPGALADISVVADFLDTLPELIAMTKIMPPYCFIYRGKVHEDWGISGVVLIAESHISIHTFPDKGFLSLDIFSCKPFNPGKALGYARRRFGFKKVEKRVFDRGLEFPRDRGRLAAHMENERGVIGGSEK